MTKPLQLTSAAGAVPDPQRLLLKPSEAARTLSISERTLWAEANARRIPVVRIGRSTRYDVRDLLAYIDARKANP